MIKLPVEFYQRDTKRVARELLGKVLVRNVGGVRASGVITETEAYLGLRDSACHTYKGRKTDRVASMWLSGGHAYVYFIYGIHQCFNVVTLDEEQPEAVLVRAIRPLEGIEEMRRRRGSRIHRDRDLTSGPGNLYQAMAIDRSCDGLSLLGKKLWIEEPSQKSVQKMRIITGPRIGVNYAKEPAGRPAALWPLRFRLTERDAP